MKIRGWELVEWQIFGWCWFNVVDHCNSITTDELKNYVWLDRFIFIGPLQTRWKK